MFGIFQRDLRAEPDGLAVVRARDDYLALLVFTFGQIAANQNLLHPGRKIRQTLRVYAGDTHSFEVDLQVADNRLCHLAEQVGGNLLRRLLARDLPNRTASQ